MSHTPLSDEALLNMPTPATVHVPEFKSQQSRNVTLENWNLILNRMANIENAYRALGKSGFDKAIHDDVSALGTMYDILASTTALLSTRVGDLSGALDTESATRAAADSAMQSLISALQTDLANETSARGSVDTALGTRIDGLASDLSDERAARLTTDRMHNIGIASKSTVRVNGAFVSEFNADTKADLDENGKVPASQLPSYIDDIVEGYYISSKFYATHTGGMYTDLITGENGKIYVDLDTNKTYRWSGSAYVEVSESLALGFTSSTAYRGDLGYANTQAISALQTALDAEATARQGADSTLDSRIAGKSSVTVGGQHVATFDADTKADLSYVNENLAGKEPVDANIMRKNIAQTMSAPLTLAGNPTEALHAATKAYVDAIRASLTLSMDPSTYILTLKYLENGVYTTLGTVDLPLESLLLGASVSGNVLTLTFRVGNDTPQTVTVDLTSLITTALTDYVTSSALTSACNATLSSANGYTDTQIGIESAARIAADNKLRPTRKSLEISTGSWSALTGADPYKYQATIQVPYTLTNDSVVELVNNSAVLFATYGFAIGAASSVTGADSLTAITVYAIDQPTTAVTLEVSFVES